MILVIVYAEGERKNLFGLERKVKSVSIGQSNTTTANLSFGELSMVTEIFTEWWFWKSLQRMSPNRQNYTFGTLKLFSFWFFMF